MTTPLYPEQPQPQEPPKPPPFGVTAQPGSRLEELLAAYEPAKAAAEEAASRFKAVTDALKAETEAILPREATRASLSGAPGLPRLKMTWMRPWRLNSKKLKEEDPYAYVKYSEQGQGYWEIRQL